MILRHDKLQIRRRNLVLAVFILLGAFVLLYAPVRGAISQTIYTGAPSVWRLGGEVSDTWSSFWGGFAIKRSLVYENNMLKEEVSRMQVNVLDRNMLEEEVAQLKEALGRVSEDNRVTANVLVGPRWSLYDTLIIDAGAENGIVTGDRVVYSGAGVIGEITEVYDNASKVKLYSSPGEEQAVVIGALAVPAVAEGRGMGNFEAKVPQGSLVIVGDEVRIPAGNLILGIVGSVEENKVLPFIRVLFRTTFNIAEVRSVEVIVNKP